MTTQTLSPKDPAEIIVVSFDFSLAMLVGETISPSPSVTASSVSGPDTSPSSILSGTAAVSGSIVSQQIINGLDGATYKLRCLATLSSGRRLALAGLLPCVTA